MIRLIFIMSCCLDLYEEVVAETFFIGYLSHIQILVTLPDLGSAGTTFAGSQAPARDLLVSWPFF